MTSSTHIPQDTDLVVINRIETGIVQSLAALAPDMLLPLQRFNHLAIRWTHAAVSMIVLIDPDQRLVLSQSGSNDTWAASREWPLFYSACQQVVDSGTLLTLDNVTESTSGTLTTANQPTRLADSDDPRHLVAFWGMPLHVADGQLIGVFCVIDTIPHPWSAEASDTLAELASGAESHLNLLIRLQRQVKTLEAHRMLIDNSADGMLVTELNGAILSANPAATHIFGYSEQDLQRIGRNGLIDPTDSRLQMALAERDRTGVFRGELRMVRADGSMIEAEISSQVYLTDTGTHHTSMIIRDITDKKRIETTLAQERTLLRTVIDNVPDFIYAKDTEARFVLNNVSHAASLSHRPEGVAGLTDFDTFPVELAETFYADDQKVIHGETLINREEVSIGQDGSRIWALTTKVPWRNAQGTIIGLVGITRDISQRKQVEAALQESETRHRSVIAALAEGITLQSADSTILAANASAERILGLSLDQIMGRTSTDPRWHAIHEDGTLFPGEEHPSIVALESGAIQSNVIMGVYKPNGALTWISINAQPLVMPGDTKPYAVVTSFSDITERIQFEKALNRHIDQLNILRKVETQLTESLDLKHALMVSLNVAMQLSAAEAGYIALLEHDHLQVAHAQGAYPWCDNLTEAPLPGAIPNRVFRSGQAEFIQAVSRDPDYTEMMRGSLAQMVCPFIIQERAIGVMILETSQTNQFTPEIFSFVLLLIGHMAGAIDNARLYGLSQQQLLELQALYSKVQSLEQLKSDMIRIASHDLRNPLANIIGFMSLLQMELGMTLSADHQFAFEQIIDNADRMSQITSDFLSLERIEAVNDWITHPVVLNQLLDRAFHQVEAQAQAKSQKLLLNKMNTPITVNGDEAQIYEALINLVVNAIKYTPANGRIDITLTEVDDQAVVIVKDTGIGVPVDMQDQLFRPFSRIRTRETIDINGTGLGLYLVKNIIERHKGSLIFESVHGQGSSFGFRLPLVVPPSVIRLQ